MNKLLEVYDPVMCCSTGVCGTDVDETLAAFANDLKWLKRIGVEVKRYNLGQEPEAFKGNQQILGRLQASGTAILPVILIDNQVMSEGGYPQREQLCSWLGIPEANGAAHNGSTVADSLLPSLARSITEGDAEQMTDLFQQAQDQGTSLQDLLRAIQSGIDQRQEVTRQLVETANRLVGTSQRCCSPDDGCC